MTKRDQIARRVEKKKIAKQVEDRVEVKIKKVNGKVDRIDEDVEILKGRP